jgi:DNA polymerase epsilon subunit 1
MSKSLEEYGDRKSCATTCAKRLGAFIGGDVMRDKGLKAQYIITSKPAGAPTSQRAVPVTIFQAEPAVARAFLKEWTKEVPLGDPDETPDMRTLVDWDYYTTRLSSAVQKIISIPAALQHVPNPCPRVAHPDWLHKMVRDKDDTFKQKKLKDLFAKHALAEADANKNNALGDGAVTPGKPPRVSNALHDMEDAHGGSLIGRTPGTAGRPRVRRFFANEAEDRAPGAADGATPTTPEAGAGLSGAGARAPGSGPSPADARAQTRAPDAVALAKRRLDALGPEPDRKEDYGSWLAFQKAKWDVLKQKRKRKRAEDAEALARASGATPIGGRATRPRVLGPGGLGAFAESREKVLARSAWQVIALEPEADADGAVKPGAFAAWILAEGSMHRVTLRVRRVLAVATRAPDREGDLGAGGKRRVVATLPRGARAAHVYEVTMDERDFVSGLETFDLLADPNVLGVFERHVPLLEAAIQKLGCVALMNEEARQKARQKTDRIHERGANVGEYDARDLESRAVAEFGYLPLAPQTEAGTQTGPKDVHEVTLPKAPPGALRHVALYRAGARDKGVFVLHTPATNTSLLVLVAPGALTANGRVRRSAAEVSAGAAATFFKRARDGETDESQTGLSTEPSETRRNSMSMSEDGGDAFVDDDDATLLDANGAEKETRESRPTREWRVEYAKSDADAGAVVSRFLSSYLERNSGPAVCCLEDAGGSSSLNLGGEHADDQRTFLEDAEDDATYGTRAGVTARSGAAGKMTKLVPALARLPVVCVPADLSDSRAMPALGWQIPATKTALARVAAHQEWLAQRVAVCRYAHIPLGNLGKDWCLHVADTFFARALRDDAQLLWTGPGGAPDLGGGAAESGSSDLDTGSALNSHARAEVCAPGAYRAVCVEFKTHHLAVCAIANAHLLNDLERGALLGYPEEARRGTGQSVRGGHEASAAFGVLRKLVNDWLVDATERFNPHADALLGQLRRWLLSDDSAMREPALRRLVELCVVKTFTLLLAEMKKLGAFVVFADVSRVIVCTGKRRLANASAFVEGMRCALRKRELFSWLELEPVRQWHALVFRGPFDYGGLVASALPTSAQWAGHDTQGPDDDELDPGFFSAGLTGGRFLGNAEALDMHWNVASFLPESLREHFEVIVSEFIFRPWKREHGGDLRDGAEETRAAAEAVALEDEGDEALEASKSEDLKKEAPPPIGREAAAAAEEERAAWLAGQVEGYFSQRVLRLVGEIQKHLGPGSATRLNPEHLFPDPPGAHLSESVRGTPALAFVKTLCAVLGLDTSVAGPVALLRKNALKLLRVPEYSPEATFREPCVTLTLRDVVCEHCGDCRDVDLCRDERVVEDGAFECAACDRAYDMNWIESTLVRRVNERLRNTQTQDLICARDGAVKVGRLASRCGCGGLFTCVERKRNASDDLRVMRSIARKHGFEVLEEVVAWVDERSPNLER